MLPPDRLEELRRRFTALVARNEAREPRVSLDAWLLGLERHLDAQCRRVGEGRTAERHEDGPLDGAPGRAAS